MTYISEEIKLIVLTKVELHLTTNQSGSQLAENSLEYKFFYKQFLEGPYNYGAHRILWTRELTSSLRATGIQTGPPLHRFV